MQKHHTDNTRPTVVTVDTIDAILMTRQQIVRTFRQIVKRLSKISSLAGDPGPFSLCSLLLPVNADCLLLQPEEVAMARLRDNLDARLWQSLFMRSELFQLMDAFTRRTWLAQHATPGSVPVVSRNALVAEFLPDARRKQALIRERAVNLYRWLSPDSAGRHPVPLRKSARVKHGVRWLLSFAMLNQLGEKRLRDLEEILLLLDGQPFPELPDSLPKKYDAFLAGEGNKTIPYQDRYFVIRCYANGSLHIQFKRKDLITRLNRLVFDD